MLVSSVARSQTPIIPRRDADAAGRKVVRPVYGPLLLSRPEPAWLRGKCMQDMARLTPRDDAPARRPQR
jgi:hypothetical protein